MSRNDHRNRLRRLITQLRPRLVAGPAIFTAALLAGLGFAAAANHFGDGNAAAKKFPRVSHCLALAHDLNRDLGVQFARLGQSRLRIANVDKPKTPPLTMRQVRITYVTHATFRIETADGAIIATDYAGYAGGVIPTTVTMNHAHTTHFTNFPDPAIKHVLRGWNPAGGPAEHALDLGDVLIRNVPTDIRPWGGGAVEKDGNSIFIFEVAGLCLGHLGHLHHDLEPRHIAKIGRLDVVMAPVDGGYTVDRPTMRSILLKLKSRLVLPMHAFGQRSLEAFVVGMKPEFTEKRADGPTLVVSLETLPKVPTVLVLPEERSHVFSGD